MATSNYSDYNYFLPAESTFKTPGTYEKALEAAGKEKAAYISSMDQFYAGLAEKRREFNRQLRLAKNAQQHTGNFDWASLAVGGGLKAAELGLNFLDSQKTWDFIKEIWDDYRYGDIDAALEDWFGSLDLFSSDISSSADELIDMANILG